MKKVSLTDEDFEWLQHQINRIKLHMFKHASEYDLEAAERIERLTKEFDNPEVIKPEKSQSTPKKRKPRQSAEVVALPRNACVEHPKYGAKRAPRTDCSGCWEFYRFLNPTTYPLALRRFELNQRRAKA